MMLPRGAGSCEEGVYLFLDKWPRRGEGMPRGISGDLEMAWMAERLGEGHVAPEWRRE